MTRSEMDLAVRWAAEEGWNPGVHDAEAFYAAYPSAFFVADREGEVVGTVSIVSYPGDVCFAAFLMVRPHMRGHGIGGMLLDHLQAVGKGKNIGGDGVVAMLPTYAARGYKFAHWHLRFKGVGGGDEDRDLTDLVDVSFEELSRYDRSIFPAPRDEFLRSFLGQEGTRTLVSIDGGKITGYGTIRPSMTGHRIGPLFADDRPTAERIMRALVANIPGEPFFIDVPEPNAPAMAMVHDHEMVEVFRAGRIYSKRAPDVPLGKVFGLTTMELG